MDGIRGVLSQTSLELSLSILTFSATVFTVEVDDFDFRFVLDIDYHITVEPPRR